MALLTSACSTSAQFEVASVLMNPVVSGRRKKQASKALLSTEHKMLPADKAYQVLSHEDIKERVGGFAEVLQATCTACKFARLPQKVLDKTDKLCRPQLGAKRPRSCPTTTAGECGGVASLSTAEVELLSAVKLLSVSWQKSCPCIILSGTSMLHTAAACCVRKQGNLTFLKCTAQGMPTSLSHIEPHARSYLLVVKPCQLSSQGGLLSKHMYLKW